MDEGLYHIHCDIQIYVWYCFFGFVLWNPFFFLTSMSVENHANMAASYPSSTSPPHHSHFPSTFPHAHPYLTHVPSLLQWAEIHPAPPASSSAASTPRTASSPPCSLSLSLSQWFFSSFFPLLHSSPFSPWFMLESSAFTPMVPLRQPPPSSSPPPTSAR